jgi:hypothetical protein
VRAILIYIRRRSAERMGTRGAHATTVVHGDPRRAIENSGLAIVGLKLRSVGLVHRPPEPLVALQAGDSATSKGDATRRWSEAVRSRRASSPLIRV